MNFNLAHTVELILCTLYAASHIFVTSLNINNSYSHRHHQNKGPAFVTRCCLVFPVECGRSFLLLGIRKWYIFLPISKLSKLETTVAWNNTRIAKEALVARHKWEHLSCFEFVFLSLFFLSVSYMIETVLSEKYGFIERMLQGRWRKTLKREHQIIKKKYLELSDLQSWNNYVGGEVNWNKTRCM